MKRAKRCVIPNTKHSVEIICAWQNSFRPWATRILIRSSLRRPLGLEP